MDVSPLESGYERVRKPRAACSIAAHGLSSHACLKETGRIAAQTVAAPKE
jgi:hypothetical protein